MLKKIFIVALSVFSFLFLGRSSVFARPLPPTSCTVSFVDDSPILDGVPTSKTIVVNAITPPNDPSILYVEADAISSLYTINSGSLPGFTVYGPDLVPFTPGTSIILTNGYDSLNSGADGYLTLNITGPTSSVADKFNIYMDTKDGIGDMKVLCAGSADYVSPTPSSNMPPAINPLSPATINVGDIFTQTGSFADPDSTSWTATVDYGDGSGVQPLSLNGQNFTLNHVYTPVGTYSVNVSITDDQGGIGTTSGTVTVIIPTTVTFDDRTANTQLNNTYAGINWGTNIWDVDGPITTDTTNSISFHTSSIASGTFSFINPEVLISTQIYSNSNTSAMITLSCSGNPNVSGVVGPHSSALLTTYWTVPCTTVTVTSSNGWNTNLDNLMYSDSSNPAVTPTPTPPPGGNTLGNTIQGSLLDTGDSGYMNGTKFTMGGTGGIASSMTVFVGNVDASPHNQYQMAIYTDSSGKPGTLVAKTNSGTLVPFSWNTLPITATLTANTTYWLLYNTNGTTSVNTINNMYYSPGATGVAAWAKRAFGTWPNTFPSATLDSTVFSIFVTY